MKSPKTPILLIVNAGLLLIGGITLFVVSSTGCRGVDACVNASGLPVVLGLILLVSWPVIIVTLVVDGIWLYRRVRLRRH